MFLPYHIGMGLQYNPFPVLKPHCGRLGNQEITHLIPFVVQFVFFRETDQIVDDLIFLFGNPGNGQDLIEISPDLCRFKLRYFLHLRVE
jgi:hypothetical protein